MTGSIGPTVAGTWYPADEASLGSQVDALLAQADRRQGERAKPAGGRIAAVIAPHAGFEYSGRVAARTFTEIRGERYRRVLLIGPSHYSAFEGAVTPASAAYRTPLGEVALDTEAMSTLEGSPHVRTDTEPFEREHSLEAEIPFLQRCLPDGWRLLPVLIGMLSADTGSEPIADALRPLLGSETLVVVSSDFTHYGPRFNYVPFDRDVPTRIEQLDRGATERILAWDRSGFASYIARTGATICGRNAIRVMFDLFPDGPRGELAAYDTSGRMTGNWQHSVSYAGLVFREPVG